MTSSPREKSRQGSRGSEEEFVLFIQGIPAHCRWQELKDLVRQTALHIRQAVVYDDQNGFPTGLGQIIVKNEEEAWRTFQRLSANGWEGHSLTVTLSRTSSPTRPIAGPTKSPSCVATSPYAAPGYTTPPGVAPTASLSPERPVIHKSTTTAYQSTEYFPVMNPMGMALQHLVPITSDSMSHPVPVIVTGKGPVSMPQPSPVLSPGFDPTAYGVYPFPTSPVQPLSDVRTNGIPTVARTSYSHQHYNYTAQRHNSADAAADSSYSSPTNQISFSKSIVIQNLISDATVQNLKDHLRAAGAVEQCEIPEDRKTGRRKGYATVSFRTTEEAKRAVALFDNSVLKGVRIRMRFDTDSNGAGEVNGGGDTRRRRSEAVERRTSATSTTTGAGSNSKSGSGGKSEDKGQSEDSAAKKLDKREPFVVNGSSVGKKATKVTVKKTETVEYDGEY
ncbi:hypothetical protein VTN00DRAFT_7931 [Thermoascus crustaceus]|uniref:uncharacterized protein n=1 Tax=Thermoascus crustaceus TaxID=5088 RepID=UPI003742D4F8